MRPNVSLGDSLTGLHAAFGAVMALLHRQRHNGRVPGQVRRVAKNPYAPSFCTLYFKIGQNSSVCAYGCLA